MKKLTERIIEPPNLVESVPIEPPVIEYQPRSESDDDDETLMPELKYDLKSFLYLITF